MNGRLPLVSVLILSVLAACAVRASAGQVIPIEDLDRWKVENFCGGARNPGFVQGPRNESGVAGMLAFDSAGNAYAACSTFIAFIPKEGAVRVLAGTPGIAGGTDGPPWQATFAGAADIAMPDDKTLYVVDGVNFTLRRLTRKDDGLWCTETVAGSPGRTGHKDGKGEEVRFKAPFDSVSVGPGGVIYMTDGDWLRKFENGTVTTLNAGSGRRDGPLAQAQFSRIMGAGHCLTYDGKTTLYLADRWNMAIRKIDLAENEVSTYAGRPAGGENGQTPRDGPALEARFHGGGGPCTAFWDGKHEQLLVMSADESRIRQIKDGFVRTFGPMGGKKAADTGPAAEASGGGGPCGVDRDGNVYIFGNGGIRVMRRSE
jgi:hypothetical protein